MRKSKIGQRVCQMPTGSSPCCPICGVETIGISGETPPYIYTRPILYHPHIAELQSAGSELPHHQCAPPPYTKWRIRLDKVATKSIHTYLTLGPDPPLNPTHNKTTKPPTQLKEGWRTDWTPEQWDRKKRFPVKTYIPWVQQLISLLPNWHKQ